MPAIVREADQNAILAYLEFFTVRIRNPNTRSAYHHAVRAFFTWSHENGLTLSSVRPIHVATYIEMLTEIRQPQTVKLHLAAIRMLYDWFVIQQVVPSNPTSPVKGPRYSIRVGKTPVLTAAEARQLLDSIETDTLIGLRDRALISFMLYTFARVSAAVGVNIGDLFAEGGHTWVRLREKGGKDHVMPLHPELEADIGAYLGVVPTSVVNMPLFRAMDRRGGIFSGRRLDRRDAWAIVQRRRKASGLATHTTCHSFRASGITAFLENGGSIELASIMAAHSNTRTTSLYDRRTLIDQNTIKNILFDFL
ncbi:tyrosine-type recombinase/integrase [Nisaea sediminum]|uniref:tyrosine-type recombinase/integrase n=1 Tax=Nisaea sediminum TaxID=2775867 RepID=UPI001D007A7F|nr:tyrosine-type recombinase/integrase [Nisaea sediminum]